MNGPRETWVALVTWVVMALAGTALVALSVSGCAHTSAGQVVGDVVTVAADEAPCAADEIQAGQDAITKGGAAWVAVLLEEIPCLPGIIRHIEAMVKTADASGQVVPLVLSRRAQRRLDAARRFRDRLTPVGGGR